MSLEKNPNKNYYTAVLKACPAMFHFLVYDKTDNET